jgi:LuxR family transcriptional regulator, maltose regulon positive regulatory protein
MLDTKIYVPKPTRRPVGRARLTDRLGGAHTKLTLVSAPAGFGKTTLLAEWIARSPTIQRSTAWLSLDEGDREPASFWAYVINALQTVAPGVGGRSLALLRDSGASITELLATLINELGAADRDIVLVLDDYHLVEGHDTAGGMEFLLEHLPPRMHLVIATRADPGLRLSRLRARGELVEIRAADLRFNLEEATSYMSDTMGLDLSSADVSALETRTEGWVAALQLAGLSMQGRADVSRFIASFAGDDRYIVDYLVEEVLQRQPDDVRAFLLDTSVLSRLNGALCDAVTGGGGGQATLEALERANLFLVALDDRRAWYRYHHLFGDVLHARLLGEDPHRETELHRRASDWHEQAGDRPEAIRHAFAAADLSRAADLVELAIRDTGRYRQEAVLRAWLELLPDEHIRARPVLSDGYAGNLLARGETEGVESRLLDAERGLTLDARDIPAARGWAPPILIADEAAFRKLPASIAIHRAGQAQLLGDVPGTIKHASRALELIDEDDVIGWASASALLGLGHWSSADLRSAFPLYRRALAQFEKHGFLADSLGLRIHLADMHLAMGQLGEALDTYQDGLELALRPGTSVLRGTADMHVGISQILTERNDLAAAAEHLERAGALGEENGLPQHPYRWRVVAARIRQASGDLEAADALLKDAERRYFTDFTPPVRPVPAVRARLLIRQGRLAEAWAWAHGQGMPTVGELAYVREFEHVTLARLMLEQAVRDRAVGDIGRVLELLDRLVAAANLGGRTGTVIDALVVQALAHVGAGDRAAAVAIVTRASVLAEPGGYVRIFVDEGAPMASLLKLAVRQSDRPAWAERLLGAFASSTAASKADQPLIEPLTERELEVLRLLRSELDGPSIARELFVSVATVRTHTSKVYAKLGVNSRRAAVRRATELGLFSRTKQGPPAA